LGAAISLADSDGVVLSGRLSLSVQSWLADHAVGEAVVLPGTAFVELAVRAGDPVGYGCLQELTLEQPLVLPTRGGVHLQVVLSAPEAHGARSVSVYARDEEAAADAPWTRHAVGVLTTAVAPPAFDLMQWPPSGAEAVGLDGFYAEMAEAGLDYGPVFQGLRAAWRRGDEIFAEIALPDTAREEADRFGLHPALLDAALHAIGLSGATDDQAVLPFIWSGVTLYATGASDLRVRIRSTGTGGGEVALEVADPAGQPVAAVESLVLRPVAADRIAAPRAAGRAALFRVDWPEVPARTAAGASPSVVAWDVVVAGGVVPDVVVLRCGGGGDAVFVRA
ncbi:polyketide synthase dehydratase domain-containing protein, partial [Streptomyces griseoviridis]